MRLVDTHAHLNDERFDGDRDTVIAALPENGIAAVVNAAFDLASSRLGAELAQKYQNNYATVGIHPHSAADVDDDALEEICKLYKGTRIVAIGEIGLDYHYDYSPRDMQQKAFRSQLALASRLEAKIVLHNREATADTMRILREESNTHEGVMHCFSGSIETAREVLDMGLYISLGGAVTFKNAGKLTEVARFVPTDRLLLETDCPYMTPEPYRGQRNEPKHVLLAARRIAEIKGISTEELADITTKNAAELFGLEL